LVSAGRPRVRAALAAVLAVLALVGAAGCGGSDHKAENAYVDAVNGAQSEFSATFDRLSSQITSTSTAKQDVRTLQGFRGAVGRAVQQLRAAKPPARVKALHDKLVRSLTAYDGALASAQQAFATSAPQRVIAAETQLTSAVTQLSSSINQTIDAINRRLRG
jgi:hypothetical protein